MISEFIVSLILAIVQGITEWVPVSSSGHLVMVSRLLGYESDFVLYVALHFGTLMAAFVYFGGNIIDIIRDFFRGDWKSENGRMGILLIIGTIPAAVIGLLFKKYVEGAFLSLWVVALGFAVTGLFLMIASIDVRRKKVEKKMSYKDSFLIGCSQALALLPGISRSGATISSGLLSGLNEKQAIRFSFLLSIPAVFGASVLTIGNTKLPPSMIWPTLLAFIVGVLTIHVLIKYLLSSRRNLKWFGLYALLLAILLIVLIALGLA